MLLVLRYLSQKLVVTGFVCRPMMSPVDMATRSTSVTRIQAMSLTVQESTPTRSSAIRSIPETQVRVQVYAMG